MTKTYLKGNAKKITGKYGDFFNISLNVEELAEYVNDKWYVNITMSERKEVWKFWDTHSLILNEYKPSPIANKNNDDQFMPF